jgi:hypothetical protein
MLALGVERQQALTTLEKVSRYSVQQFDYIITSRRVMEATAKRARGETPYRGWSKRHRHYTGKRKRHRDGGGAAKGEG